MERGGKGERRKNTLVRRIDREKGVKGSLTPYTE